MTATYNRQCENWLTEFGNWTLPRSEAPYSFIFWTGLFALASSLRRHVKVPRTILGSWECAPNLYVMFVADPGKARKTTTVNYVEDLLDEIPSITRAPDLITKESLLTTVAKSDDSSMCINAPEFGEFIVKSGVEMYGFLTNGYDGKKRLSASTISRGLELTEKPCFNLLGATTPVWIASNMPESIIGGGFASRVVFIYEERVRRREIFYDDLSDYDPKENEELGKKLIGDLTHISKNLHGDFGLAPEARKFMREWYHETAEDGTAENYKMHGYYERRPAHVFKVAMCLHVAYSDELVLTLGDIKNAIEILQQIERKLPQTFAAIGKNPYTVDMNRIIEFVAERGKVTREDIFTRFYHVAEPDKMMSLVNGILQMGKLKVVGEGEKTYFALANGKGGARAYGKSFNGDPSLVDTHQKAHQEKNAEFDPH